MTLAYAWTHLSMSAASLVTLLGALLLAIGAVIGAVSEANDRYNRRTRK